MNQTGRFHLNTVREKLNHTFLVHQSETRIPDIHQRHTVHAAPASGKPGIHPLGLDDDIGVKGLVGSGDFVKIRKSWNISRQRTAI